MINYLLNIKSKFKKPLFRTVFFEIMNQHKVNSYTAACGVTECEN